MDSVKASKTLVALSVQVAAKAPKKRPRHEGVAAANAMIPWSLVEALRKELDRLGYGEEWRYS